MIISSILFIIGSFFVGLVKIFDVFPMADSMTTNFTNAVISIIDKADKWDWIFPISDAKNILKWSFVMLFATFLWKQMKWVLGWVRGSGG